MKKVSRKMVQLIRPGTLSAVILMVLLLSGCSSIPQLTAQEEREHEQIVMIESAEVDPEDSNPKKVPEPDSSFIPAERKPMVALTFDDGPFHYTDQILDILEKYGVRATFFVVGKEIKGREDSIIRAAQNGNEIAGHTWDHKRLTDLSNREIAETIKKTSDLIEKVTGIPSPPFMRPTYGLVNARVANVCSELGYTLINWTVDPQDWLLLNANKVYDAVMRTVRENSIILLHELFATTVAATERLIPALLEKGYEFVVLSELMAYVYGELKPGRVYGSPGLVH